MTTLRDLIDGVVRGTADWETGLDVLTVAPPAEAEPLLRTLLWDTVARLVRGGWQPAELHRAVARRGDPAAAALTVDAIAAYRRKFTGIDPRWAAQADELDARVWWSSDDAYLREVASRDRIALLDSALGLLRTLSALPPIEILIPPPGTTVAARVPRGTDRRLDRVRALLAKAESTAFPAEAEAYSAKAQELIARHSLHDALTATAEVVPLARRVGVDHPYESEKAALLDAVARANRCRTVWSPELAFSTVFGFDADIDAVELLHTSLLVQAHRAMTAAEPRAGKARIKAFRRSFLIAYASRIGERLDEASRQAVAEIASPADLLPVLAARDVQVTEAMHRAFPRTVRARGPRVDSVEGWESGREAADRADLGKA